MKDQAEVKRAHDTLICVLKCDQIELAPNVRQGLTAAVNMLCWVLDDENAEAFAGDLANIHKIFKAHGLHLIEGMRTVYP